MLLNFKKQFVEPIRLGTKHHTIRGDRKDGYVPKPGEPLYLYCGARTKHCFKILEQPPPCRLVQRIHISTYKMIGTCWAGNMVFVDGVQLAPDESEQLARCDGFPDFMTMMAFWEGRLPFTGNIIHWR
jgi:hypothetical protein